MNRLVRVMLVCICLISSTHITCAQETTAAIQGTVTDPTGAVVAGADITVKSDKLITPATTKSDSHGFYRFNALPPGAYSMTIAGGGMKATQNNITLVAGELPTLNIKLALGSETQIVDVSSTVAMVDVTQSKVETTIDNQTLQAIPKGRSFQSVIPFAPGARQEPLQSGNSNRLNGFQIDGASNGENVFASDGLNITAVVGGGVGVNVPIEFVQDVQVKSSSFEAEFGGALGGVINVIQQRGSSKWHGSLITYYASSAFNANDQCNFPGAISTSAGFSNTSNLYNTTCGLRLDPTTKAAAGTRSEQSAQFYIAKKDHFRSVDPGFTIGGPLLQNKVFLFASYIPNFSRIRRTATFTGLNPGPRTFYRTADTHFGLARLDYSPFSKVRLFGSWQYSYNRTVGSLPNPDSAIGQVNASSSTDPTTIRADTGTVNPLSLYTFGADYTLTSKTLITARYGYYYQDTHDIGKPVGTRYLFQSSSAPGSFTGTAVPSSVSQTTGYSNLGANQQILYDVLTRKQFNIDVSTLKTGWYGNHEFKVGYALYHTGENVLQGFNTSYTQIYPGTSYTTKTSSSACDTIIAQNKAAYPGAPSAALNSCQGDYGYFIVSDGVDTNGKVTGNNNAFYGQDSWTLGRTGLTINAGIRFDKEYLPPYDPADPVSINFGWTSKVAPRVGAAYDLLHNGRVKLYGSYGKFFDIVKFSLPRGSFGGDYWHDCAYALDSPDYTLIQPTAPGGHACPKSGPAPGVPSSSGIASGSFRFIENMDYRAHTQDAADPQVDPNLKPMSQHEYVVGVDWAVRPTLSFTARYARKILDNTIEDISVNDAVYYIGNPGPGYGDPLHRAADQLVSAVPGPLASQFDNAQGVCPSCPVQPKATRHYNGLELRVTKNSSRGSISAFYTLSKLTGNYPGLTSTFITDGGGGRTSPNNNRSFDLPQMQFTAHGKPFGGPLPTDRPNTFGAYGSLHQRWSLGTSQLAFSQTIYQGTPVSTCWSTISTTSSCQFVEDQGNWVNVSRDASGNFISNGISQGRRTPAYLQTDLNITHYVSVSKDHENRRIGAEMNILNALNQHAVTAFYETPIGNGSSAVAPKAANATTFDYYTLMTNFDYIGETNKENLYLATRYGMPQQFQLARQIRIKIAYVF
ncbi:MAG: carboxypeptidase regulatory-like domain-containing protein [Acidobacteriota bacterium]|nr:carboxypeptidase regulatory-like domain-containing protein [Acidobacteriota bacterium]